MIKFFEIALLVVTPIMVILIAGFLGWKRNIIQSGIKLGTVILSILCTFIIVKIYLPTQVDAFLSSGVSLIEDHLALDFKGSSFAADLFLLLITILMPLFFTAVFFVMNAIFSLLYLIPGRLFSNKSLARRAANRETAAIAVSAAKISSVNMEVTNPSNEVAPDNSLADCRDSETANGPGFEWKKFTLRACSIVCSVLAGVLVLSSFMLPVSFYADFAASCAVTFDLADIDSDSAEIVDAVYELDGHFTVNCYQLLNMPVSAGLDTFKSHNGTKVIATDSALDMLQIVGYLSSDEPSSDECYKIADKLDDNSFLNETFTGIAADMLDTWKAGESVIIGGANAMPTEYIEMFDNLLRDDRPFSVVLRLMGDVLYLNESMQSDDPEALGVTVEHIVYNMHADAAEAFKDLLETSYVESVGDNADMFRDFTEAVLDSIVEINEDTSLNNDEKDKVLKQEAESLTKILELSAKDEDVDLLALVDVCISSATLTDAVLVSTESGSQKDPYGFADSFTDEMVNDVCNKLQKKGFQEGSSTYKAYLALISGV